MIRVSLLAIVFAVALLAAACSDDNGASSPTATTPSDYVVVGKAIYSGDGSDGKRGRYVSFILFGAERETVVSLDCYNRAVVGQILARDCR